MSSTLNLQMSPMAKPSNHDENNLEIQKIRIIRETQIALNTEPCFRSERRHDCAEMCEWRRDCRKLVAIWRR